MKSVRAAFCCVALFASCGCAHLATVKQTRPVVPATGSDKQLQPAIQRLAAWEREQPLVSLGDDLFAARFSLNVLEQQPDNLSARNLYNFSVARAVANVERANIQPWRREVSVTVDQTNYLLTTPKPVDQEHDPSRYDLFPTDSLKISGQFFKTRPSISGIGAPLVAVGRVENPRSREQFKLRRVYAPVTAVIKFADKRAELEFVDPMKTERVAIGKRTFPLAIDLNAPTAMLIARERPERLGFARLINPQKYADTTRLTQLQQFDPARTPVIFVHGLQETGASWAPMIDSLRNDPWIRESLSILVLQLPQRLSLSVFSRAVPPRSRWNRSRVSQPQTRRAHRPQHGRNDLPINDHGRGRQNLARFFSTSPAKTPLASDTRKLLEESLVFNHRPDVQRVIFISTPHRGSKLASGWIGRIGAALVRTPRLFTSVYTSIKPLLVADPAARTLKRMPNSVDTLEPNDRFVQAVNKLPITPGIPYHSIMGDRGRGNTPNSSDGIVPYWSSHLDGAQSELIVDSGHDAQSNPEAIHEVARILKENLAVGSR